MAPNPSRRLEGRLMRRTLVAPMLKGIDLGSGRLPCLQAHNPVEGLVHQRIRSCHVGGIFHERQLIRDAGNNTVPVGGPKCSPGHKSLLTPISKYSSDVPSFVPAFSILQTFLKHQRSKNTPTTNGSLSDSTGTRVEDPIR
jgi:hypothetical protein